MVQAIDRHDPSRSDAVFEERRHELEESASKQPKPVPSSFPYLMEISSGFVHPYNEYLAARGDLVIGCYTVDGSLRPEDQDPLYRPDTVYSREEMRNRVRQQPLRSLAERQADLAAREIDLEKEVERRVLERIKQQTSSVQALDEPEQPKAKRSSRKANKPVVENDAVGQNESSASHAPIDEIPEPVESLEDVANKVLQG